MADLSSDEEKILLEREYARHLGAIEKSETRERHFRLKEEGYNLSIDRLDHDLVCVFLGYVEALGVDKGRIYRGIARALLDPSCPVSDNLRRVMALGVDGEDSIVSEVEWVQ